MVPLETERLILRPFTAEDADALHGEIYSDREVVSRSNGGKTMSLEEVRRLLAARLGGSQFGYWAVERKADGKFLGQVHLSPYVNAGWYQVPGEESLSPIHNLEVELAFAFGKLFWGQGYAAEACRQVIRYAFTQLRLKRLVGGADASNLRSVRLQERLGYRVFVSPDGSGVTTVLDNPLAAYVFRPYREEDRAGASALGTHVIDWWFAKGLEASLHLVAVAEATGEIVGHLQAVDQGVPEPSRRPGQCHFCLEVAPDHQGKGIGSALYRQVEAFARRRQAHLLYAAYSETEDAPAAPFLKNRGFEPLERFCPSVLDLNTFDPARFQHALERVQRQGIVLQTYAAVGDTPENRRCLHLLEQSARGTQPFREVDPYVPEAFGKWEVEFSKRDPATIFIALSPEADKWIGVVTGLEWYFTGVDPAWRGKGIATALKVLCIMEAKKRGIAHMETENHQDNAAMLAINRKLGFVFTAPEVACIKRLPVSLTPVCFEPPVII